MLAPILRIPPQVGRPRGELLVLPPLDPARAAFASEVAAGLSSTPKSLPPAHMFDEHGAALWDAVARPFVDSELTILRAHAEDIANELGSDVRFVDLVAGDGSRTALLAEKLLAPIEIVLADRTPDRGLRAAHAVAPRFANVRVRPKLHLPEGAGVPTAFYLGASVAGELEPKDLRAELKRLAIAAPARLLVGLDLRRDGVAHEAAWSAPEVAVFDANLLARCNREIGGRFDLSAFEHRAVWDKARSRLSMQLVSTRWQWAAVHGEWVHFEAGEPIVTMIATKYTVSWFSAVASSAGWKLRRVFLSPARDYAMLVLST